MKKNTRDWQVGDQFRVVGRNPKNIGDGYEGQIGTIILADFSNVENPLYGIEFNNGLKVYRWSDRGDMELIRKSTNIMKKVGSMFKRLVDADTQALYKAGYINGDLELTEKGSKELMVILFDANKKSLVDAANQEIVEEEKTEE